MDLAKEFARYVAYWSLGLGDADRHAGLSGHCTGLMLPLSRKSVEPMAARVDPLHASAPPSAASLRGQVGVVGRTGHGAGVRLGCTGAWT